MKQSSVSVKFGVIGAAILFSIVVLTVDRSAGPFIRMPVLFVIPVMALSWHLGIIARQIFAVGLPLFRLLTEWSLPKPGGINDSIICSLNDAQKYYFFNRYIINRTAYGLKHDIIQGTGTMPF